MQNYSGCAQVLSWGEVAELSPFRGTIPEDGHHVVDIGAGQGGALDLWDSITPFPAQGFQIPLPGHVTSQLPADPTQSRAEPCRHSQEHSYYKLSRNTK